MMINHGHRDSIGFFEGVLSGELCERILDAFLASGKKGAGTVVNPEGQNKQTCGKISIDLDVAEIKKEIRDAIHENVSQAFLAYQGQFESLRPLVFRTMGYRIQRYPKGEGQFIWHCDATSPATYNRQVALVLYLNSLTAGGETEFSYQDIRISPQQGCCIFFPPFWTHRHRGAVPLSDDKFVITSFFERVTGEMDGVGGGDCSDSPP